MAAKKPLMLVVGHGVDAACPRNRAGEFVPAAIHDFEGERGAGRANHAFPLHLRGEIPF